MLGKPEQRALLPYVARLHAQWHQTAPTQRHRRVSGTLVVADISGFTSLTERSAEHGRAGSVQMSDTLDEVFTDLLTPVQEDAADLVEWGADTVLLLFTGEHHEARACRSAHAMRGRMRSIVAAGTLPLRMSVGVHSSDFDCYLVGDPGHHVELLVSGPAVSICAGLEAAAGAGEIAVSDETLDVIGDAYAGRSLEGGALLKSCPDPSRPVQVGRQRGTQDLTPLLPPEIRNHLLLGDLEPEHRDAAVAFVSYSGTDDLSWTEGPDAVAEALHEVIVNVSHATAGYGVTFLATDVAADGGTIMLAAGVPTSQGKDSEQLLRACRRILEDAGRLPLRIGVSYGQVFAGDFGPCWRRTYSIKGEPVDVAARVVGLAQPGQLRGTISPRRTP